MQLSVVICQDSEGWYIGNVPGLHGCRTQANTLPELLERLQEVATLCLEEQDPDAQLKFVGVQNIEISSHA